MASALLAEYRVGPKGYIHGWIFVGAPGIGAKVFHPEHGHGTVTGVGSQHATVTFGSGAEHSFERKPGEGEPRLEPREPSHSRVTSAGGLLQNSLSAQEKQNLAAEVKTARKRLSAPQMKTIEQWTSGKGMVRRIQQGSVSESTARAFDEAMHEAPKVHGLVYRGVEAGTHGEKLALSLKAGGVLRLDEPVSTSIEPRQAGSFGGYIFEIESPSAAYVSGIGSKYAYEKEAVLPPGEYRVVTVEAGKVGSGHSGKYREVRIIRLVDVTKGDRSWRPTGPVRRSAPADDSDDRSDRFMQGDGLGQFKLSSSGDDDAPPPAPERAYVPADRVLGVNDLLARLEWRTAETPVVSTVHHPFGSPAGPGLFHVKGLQLPAYIQNVAHAFTRKGVPESTAIARAVGVVKDWAAGRAPNGGRVHPDVQAAAAKAIAEWEAAKAAAHGKRFNQFHLGAGPGGGEFTTAGGAGKSGSSAKASGGHAQGTSQPASHGPAPKGTGGKTRAQHKQHLLAQAKDDRQKAHELRQELHQLEQQHAQNVKQYAKSKKAAQAASKINPHAKHHNPGHKHQHNAAHHHQAAKHAAAKTKTLATKIADLKHQIHVLLTAAASLEAQAKRL